MAHFLRKTEVGVLTLDSVYLIYERDKLKKSNDGSDIAQINKVCARCWGISII